MRVSTRFFSVFAILACALVLAFGCAGVAWGATEVFTATAVPSYENPDTGEVEDSAGNSNLTLASAMVTGIVQPYALVEKFDSGDCQITVRFYETDVIGDVAVAFDQSHSGAFGEAAAVETVQQDMETKMGDYRFTVPSEDATLRFEMYVEPMGRNVVFFVTLSNLVQGNEQGFVTSASVDDAAMSSGAQEPSPSETQGASSSSPTAVSVSSSQSQSSEAGAASGSSQAADAASAASSQAATAGESVSSAATAAGTSAQASSVREDDAPAPAAGSANASAATGVREFDADGHDTNTASNTDQADALNYPLIVGVLVGLAVIVALIVYATVLRPRRMRADAAAAAAMEKAQKPGVD